MFGKKKTQQEAEIEAIKQRYAIEREYIREANRRSGNAIADDMDQLNDNDVAR